MRKEKEIKKNKCHTERSRSIGAMAPPPFSGHVILSVVEGGGWEGVGGSRTVATITNASSFEVKYMANSNSALVSTANARTLRQAQDDMPASTFLFNLSVLCAFPLRSLRLKHSLLLITILLITNNPAQAQTPYTGGSGDGHAMGELVLRNVGANELGTADGYNIYPSQAKTGETIYITCPTAGTLQLIDINGRIIHTQTLEQPVQQLPVIVTQAGLCIGIIRTQAGTFTQKIIVVE